MACAGPHKSCYHPLHNCRGSELGVSEPRQLWSGWWHANELAVTVVLSPIFHSTIQAARLTVPGDSAYTSSKLFGLPEASRLRSKPTPSWHTSLAAWKVC
jgi:hypothetical protein